MTAALYYLSHTRSLAAAAWGCRGGFARGVSGGLQVGADAEHQNDSRSWSISILMQFWTIPGVLEIRVATAFVVVGVGFAKPFATMVQIVVWGVGSAKPWASCEPRQAIRDVPDQLIDMQQFYSNHEALSVSKAARQVMHSARGGATNCWPSVADMEAVDELDWCEEAVLGSMGKLEPVAHLCARLGASDDMWTAVRTCGDGACALHSVWGTATDIPGVGTVLFCESAREKLLADMPATMEGLAVGTARLLASRWLTHLQSEMDRFAQARMRNE